jgi:hypothetical protein
MFSPDPSAVPAKSASHHLTVRRNMESIADALGLELGVADDAGLAIRIDDRLSATITPGRNERLVAMFRIGRAETLPIALWISALSEAAGWGLNGERQRFVVLDGDFTLLWTTPPQDPDTLLAELYELFATALAVANIAQRRSA